MKPSRKLRTVLPLFLTLSVAMAILGLVTGSTVSADLVASSEDPFISSARGGTTTAPTDRASLTTIVELTPVADTWVDEDHPSTNYGGANNLVAGNEDYEWALLKFDLSSLPAYFDVQSATLEMYTRVNRAVNGDASILSNELKADAVTDGWEEMVVDWNSRPASENLLDPPTTFVVDGWTAWDVSNIVQSWGDGSLPNQGIRVWAVSGVYGYAWWSRETTDPPKLTISYTEASPPCNPITDVDVSGATSGVTGVSYTFYASPSPGDADPPDAISWQVTDYAERFYGDSITVSWATPGEKRLDLVVSHCGGSTLAEHTVDISGPPPACTQPLEGVFISGPLLVDTGASHAFQAFSLPAYATDPVTFTWDVTGQTLVVDVNDVNQSSQSYMWSTAGNMRVRVTGENCGGSAVAYHDVDAVDPADLPDLMVSSAWNDKEQGRIGYVMRNQGDTAVPPGFYVSLEQGVSTPGVDPYPHTLGPGDIGLGYVDFEWACGSVSETVGVLADWGEEISELDETNNRWSDVWACDQQPPNITSGPTVTFVSETRAMVEWDTDEDCQGWVEYGTSPYNQSAAAPGSGAYATSHAVTINGLTAGTTYYAAAFCTDVADLTVNSAPLQFETAPPGSDPPVVRSITTQPYPSSSYEYWQVDVEMENDEFMDRVSCSFDGVLLGIDYSADTGGDYPVYSIYLSPHALGLTRAAFFAPTSHEVSCTAYRQDPAAHTTLDQTVAISGEVDPPIKLTIDQPYPNYKLYIAEFDVPDGTTLDVTARAAAYEWACSYSGFSEGDVVAPGLDPVDCDDLTPLSADQVDLEIDGTPKDTMVPGPSELYVTLTGLIEGLDQGDHEILVRASGGALTTEKSRTLIVEKGDAGLEVTRSIRREGNTLKVTLELYNAGTINANLMRIVDHVIGLQPILQRDESLGFPYEVGIYDIEPLNDGSGARHLHVGITFPIAHAGTDKEYYILEPGESVSLNYVVVPELHEANRPPLIGTLWDPTKVVLHDEHFGYAYQSFDLRETLVNDPSYGIFSLEDATANAIALADYIIVTIPTRVYGMLTDSTLLIPDEDAERLFSNMAELASLENGVLGYLQYYDTHPLDDLLEPGGRTWTDQLDPVFNEKDNGYVLLVGETEIVPSFYVGESNFATYPGIPDHVHESDLPYANTAGETARPELVVGRVVGNSLEVLNAYLENMIHAARGEPGYGFNRSTAYVTNGNGDGESWFQVDAGLVDLYLDAALDQSTWINFIGDDGYAQRTYHLTHMPNKDMILYRGHGNEDDWDDGFLAGDIDDGVYDFGDTNPAMFAAACETGNYEKGSDLNLSELVLEYGAGVYAGATEKSERWSNSDAFINFPVHWGPADSMGQALNETKRVVWDMDGLFDNRKLWAYETNLYGDPKYGRAPAAVTLMSQQVGDETLSVTAAPQGLKLKVSLPELTINQIDGGDVPRIPGGWTLAELGAYPVPVWSFSVDFPPGQIVQDVQLISRGTPVVTGDLSLPVVTAETDCGCAASPAAPAQPTATGWYPDLDKTLDWSLEKHADGASTLRVVLYPFTYYADSGDALYHRWYTLDVQTINTVVRLESLDAPSIWSARAPAPLSLIVSNGYVGRPLDVIVQPSVRELATGEVLGGLPLTTLHDLEGTATVDLAWDTRPYAPGDYMLVVELLSTSGRLLDTASAEVRLGEIGAKLNSLGASEEIFNPGNPITLTMSVVNTGTVAIDGTAVFIVHESDTLSATATITAPINALGAGRSAEVSVVWDSTGAEKPVYWVLGYVKYRSLTTEPLELVLRRPRVFLPLVVGQP
jgi:hypothetical protein